MGQRDIQADRATLRLKGPPVPRLHDPRPTPGDDGVPTAGEVAGELDRLLVDLAILPETGRPEDGDRLANIAHLLEALHQFAHDAEHPPAIRGQSVDDVLLLEILHALNYAPIRSATFSGNDRGPDERGVRLPQNLKKRDEASYNPNSPRLSPARPGSSRVRCGYLSGNQSQQRF